MGGEGGVRDSNGLEKTATSDRSITRVVCVFGVTVRDDEENMWPENSGVGGGFIKRCRVLYAVHNIYIYM